MDLRVGDYINIRHFSSNVNFIVRIVQIEGANLYLEFYKIRKETGISLGDPAVLICNTELGIVVKGGIISELFRGHEKLSVRYDENCDGISKRIFERYPVSLDSDLKFVNESKRYSTLIKDISKFGFKVLANLEIDVGQKIELSPFLNKKIVFIAGTIVRSIKKALYYEYGVSIDSNDFHSVQELSSIIKNVQEEYITSYSTTDEGKKQQITNLKLIFDATENKVVFESPKNLEEATDKLDNILRRMRY